jgi:F-type H+-transporting ATPase subunit b
MKSIVIGSGFGGIAAALRLKAKNHNVILIEKHDDLGGRARVFKKNGFTFDAGPTVITAPYLIEELFELFNKRSEAKILLDNAQSKLDTAQTVSNEILEQAKKDSDHMVIEMNDKFHKSSEIKKKLAESKIIQMKDAALKEIKDVSIRIAVESVKRIISTSVDKSKLDSLFDKNLEETKVALKKINS